MCGLGKGGCDRRQPCEDYGGGQRRQDHHGGYAEARIASSVAEGGMWGFGQRGCEQYHLKAPEDRRSFDNFKVVSIAT